MKTERNESRGLLDLSGRDCLVETEYATISGPLLFAFVAFCKAAIRGDQHNPDNSKFIRGGTDSALEAKSAKGIIESRKRRGIESSLCDISAVFVIDSKLPEFNKG